MRTSILSIFLVLTVCSCHKTDTNPDISTPLEWHLISSQPNTLLFSVYFTDSKKGFAVGSVLGNDGYSLIHGTIFKTSTGGSSWVNISNDTLQNLSSVFFTDSLTGYAVGTNSILKTNNAGNNWSTIFIDSNVILQSIFFVDKNTGYAVGISGVIMKTTNGGQNWEYLTSGTHCQLQSVYFTDNQNGYAVGYWNETSRSYGIILKTKNGGDTWDSIPFIGETMPGSVVFTTANIGYAVGSNSILKTTDAGLNWAINYSSPYLGLNAASFIRNSPSGFVVGQNGIILKTIDAGMSWTDVSGESESSLTSVYFVNQNIGYAVGFDQQSKIGTILKWQ
jgi:photosystem II stability/assembly factor-like uncharacterized protein